MELPEIGRLERGMIAVRVDYSGSERVWDKYDPTRACGASEMVH